MEISEPVFDRLSFETLSKVLLSDAILFFGAAALVSVKTHTNNSNNVTKDKIKRIMI